MLEKSVLYFGGKTLFLLLGLAMIKFLSCQHSIKPMMAKKNYNYMVTAVLVSNRSTWDCLNHRKYSYILFTDTFANIVVCIHWALYSFIYKIKVQIGYISYIGRTVIKRQRKNKKYES